MRLASLLGTASLLVAVEAANGIPTYKNPNVTIDERVSDLLGRMSIKDKMSQLIQGDMRNYLNLTDGSVNKTGLEWSMEYRSHAVWTGLYAEKEIINKAAKVAQDYLVNETELGEYLVEALRNGAADAFKEYRPSSRAKDFTDSSPSMPPFSTLQLPWDVLSTLS